MEEDTLQEHSGRKMEVALRCVVKRGMRQGATQKMLQLREGVSKAESLSPLQDVTDLKYHISTCNCHE